MRLLSATEILPEERLRELQGECNELIAILTTIIKRMREKQSNFKLQTSNFRWRGRKVLSFEF